MYLVTYLKNPHFCSFASFLIVSPRLLINKLDSSRGLIISMILFISSLENIKVVAPDPNIFLWVVASVAIAAAVNPNAIDPNQSELFWH